MIAIIDNYDSFTYNLVQRLGEIDPDLELAVYRNDQIGLDDLAQLNLSHLIISPGPCTPKEAGISVACIERFHSYLPILGVCLGHQSIGQATGGEIVRAERLMHGKTDQIEHTGTTIFAGLPSPMTATRYHSLVIKPETLSSEFEINAWTFDSKGNKMIMGIEHREFPTFGVQFHPESFLTERGIDLLKNFLSIGGKAARVESVK
jgi:anthranilate synthase component 2